MLPNRLGRAELGAPSREVITHGKIGCGTGFGPPCATRKPCGFLPPSCGSAWLELVAHFARPSRPDRLLMKTVGVALGTFQKPPLRAPRATVCRRFARYRHNPLPSARLLPGQGSFKPGQWCPRGCKVQSSSRLADKRGCRAPATSYSCL